MIRTSAPRAEGVNGERRRISISPHQSMLKTRFKCGLVPRSPRTFANIENTVAFWNHVKVQKTFWNLIRMDSREEHQVMAEMTLSCSSFLLALEMGFHQILSATGLAQLVIQHHDQDWLETCRKISLPHKRSSQDQHRQPTPAANGSLATSTFGAPSAALEEPRACGTHSPSIPKSRPMAVSLYSSAVELNPVRFASFRTSVMANFCLKRRILIDPCGIQKRHRPSANRPGTAEQVTAPTTVHWV